MDEKRMPGFKAAKDRLTLLLGGNASGDLKLKPLLVYHSQNPRAFKGVSINLLPVHWKANKKAWITMEFFEEWFVHIFIPAVKLYCNDKGIPFKILLLVDNAPGHPQSLNNIDPNVKVVFLPPNTTSLLQPMDQTVISTFKSYYHRMTYRQCIRATDGEDAPTLKEFWKNYNILMCVKNIAAAWDEVEQKTMNRAWRKLCPQFVPEKNNFKGFEEVEIAKRQCLKMANELDLNLEEEDIQELFDCHNQELTNEDLMELEAHRIAEEEARALEPEEAQKKFTLKGLQDAFRAFDAAVEQLEAMDNQVERTVTFQRGLRDILGPYRFIEDNLRRSAVQPTLDAFFKPKAALPEGEPSGRFTFKAEELPTEGSSDPDSPPTPFVASPSAADDELPDELPDLRELQELQGEVEGSP